MTDTSGKNAVHKLSAVVAFRARDLVMPKGIDAGEMLAWASAEELVARHLELASNAKAFWKDGFLLYTLWGHCQVGREQAWWEPGWSGKRAG